MKVLRMWLIVAVLFLLAGTALAGDPYVGTYSCSDEPVQGCSDCKDFNIEGPNQMVVKQDGSVYHFCPQGFDAGSLRAGSDDCTTGKIVSGVATWDGTDTFEGMTIKSHATATFSGNTLTLREDGVISGLCNCKFSLTTMCTK